MKQVTRAAPVQVTPAPAPALARKCACGSRQDGQCKSCDDEKKGMVQRKATRPGEAGLPVLDDVAEELRAPGQALDAETRTYMESRFGHDFGDVRIHTGGQASASAGAVGAQAYTVGNHIVFAAGQYLPHTETGRQLLAHELTHTLQQRAMPSIPLSSMPLSHPSDFAEREADAIAARVVSGEMTAHPAAESAPPRIARSGQPVPEPNPEKKKILKEAHDIEEIPGNPPEVVLKGLRWFDVKKAFPIPAEKGPEGKKLFDRVTSESTSGLLMAANTSGGLKRAIKAARGGNLPVMWREQLNWLAKEQEQLWIDSAAAASVSSNAWAKAGAETCQFDHIMELQMGGPDTGSNLAAVGQTANLASAAAITAEIRARIGAIVDAYKDPNIPLDISQAGLRYQAAEQTGSKCDDCCRIDAQARLKKGAEPTPGASEEWFELKWSAFAQKIIVPQDRKLPVPIEKQSAQRLVPGFVLETLDRSKKEHVVHAEVEPNASMPITLPKGQKVQFRFDAANSLSLKKPKALPEFGIKGLSKAKITKLDVGAEGLIATGTIEPSLPILKKLPLTFTLTPDTLSAQLTPQAKNQTIQPITGVAIVKPTLGVSIFPDFRPEGSAGFVVGANYLKGTLKMSADGSIFIASADVTGKVPGLESAEGTVSYRADAGWTGQVNLKAAAKNFKFIESADVKIGMSDQGVAVTGNIMAKPPGLKKAILLTITRDENGNLSFRGAGVLELPKLPAIDATVAYSGAGFSVSGKTTFTLFKKSQTIFIEWDSKQGFSGTVKTFTFEKGSATVTLHDLTYKGGKFTGAGEVVMPLGKKFLAKGTVALDEEQNLKISAALKIAEPIPLFDAVGGKHEFFNKRAAFPIPGASIGGIGLKATIRGALSAGYTIGPAVLKEATLEAGIDPLKTNGPAVSLSALMVMTAKAWVSGTIEGGVLLDGLIAEIEGSLALTATASLTAESSASASLLYTPEHIVADGMLKASLGLALLLALDAKVRASAGIGWLSVSTEKVWNLGSWPFAGPQLGMTAQIHYDSLKEFQLPTINFTEPELSAEQMINGPFEKAEKTAKEKDV